MPSAPTISRDMISKGSSYAISGRRLRPVTFLMRYFRAMSSASSLSLRTESRRSSIALINSGFLRFWYIPTILILGVAIAIYVYVKTPQGRYKFHYFKYKMPIFGSLIYAIDFSRLMQAILLNLKNGMRIQDALETSKSVARNLVLLSLVETSINNILVGQSWIEPFEKSGLSTPMVTEMLKIGMQTDLTEMIEKLVEYMQTDIDNILGKITKVLPQIIYIIVGILLIFVTIVVLVPAVQIYMGTWLFSAYL